MTDDFENDKEIQKIRKERAEYARIIEDSIGILKNQLSIEEASDRNLDEFYMFKSLKTAAVSESFQSTNPHHPIHISIVEYTSEYHTAKAYSTGSNPYFFGLIDLNKEYPRTFIFKESIREILMDIFTKAEIDFKDQKKFSRKFYTVTEDKEKLIFLLQNKNLNEIATYANAEIEIKEKKCLFRASRKSISVREAETFCGLAKVLNNIL